MRYALYTLIVLLVSLGGGPFRANAQVGATDQETATTAVLNDCVHFANESIHGMLIVHRLLENFNQKLNLYVDLEGQQLNFYSNADLPRDIFEDPDGWFYDDSPMELYEKALGGSNSLKPTYRDKINPRLAELKGVIRSTNQLRFELEALLNKAEGGTVELNRIYDKLEEGVKMYNQCFVVRNGLEEALMDIYDDMQIRLQGQQSYQLHQTLAGIHREFLNGARHYRFEEIESLSSVNLRLASHLRELPEPEDIRYLGGSSARPGQKPVERLAKIKKQAADYMATNSQYLSGPQLPAKYDQYGASYYYHNIHVLSQLNRYGNGIAHEMNELISASGEPYLLFIEEPHRFKVIYPEKLEKQEVAEVEVPQVEEIPTALQDRELVKRQSAITASSDYVDIEIYDHQKLDRDIVSINYNGEWILENYTITDKPRKIRLQLNAEGVNYLVLHAVNEGVIPPNTMALEYVQNGKRERIVLNSSLNQSEVIEFRR